MNELEFFLFKGVLAQHSLAQNSNIMQLVKFIEKNQRLHIQIGAVILKTTLCMIMSRKHN
jgi:hypothetical protein